MSTFVFRIMPLSDAVPAALAAVPGWPIVDYRRRLRTEDGRPRLTRCELVQLRHRLERLGMAEGSAFVVAERGQGRDQPLLPGTY